MKKFLALMIAVVIAFSMVAVPVNATETNVDIEKVETTVNEAFTFAENLANAIHKLVGDILAVFDKECPFCDKIHDRTPAEDVPVTPDEPVNPDEPNPEEPSEPEETVNTIANQGELSGATLAGGKYLVVETFEAESCTIEKDVKVDMDLQGHTISGAVIYNKGDITIKGGSIEAPNYGIYNEGTAILTDIDMKAGSASSYAAVSNPDSYTEYNNFDLASAGGGIGVLNSKVVFNSGSVDVNSTTTSARYNFYVTGENAELTINDGNFSLSGKSGLKRAFIYADSGTTVIINGGNFGPASTRAGYTAGILGSGTVIIKGGTFGFNPTNWVAEGFVAVKDGSVWNVVAA